MAGKRNAKLLQATFCLIGAAILLSAPSVRAITYDAGSDWTLYGDLNQNSIPVIGSLACGPAAAVNSFVYLQNSHPGIYGHALVPDLHGTLEFYETDELVTVAEVLGSPSYMNTMISPDPNGFVGTYSDWLIYGKWRYIGERLPGSTIYAAQFILGWPEAPWPQPSWVEQAIPTWSFLYEGLAASADVEICINGYADHFLTLTRFYWDDTNDDGFIDDAEDAWIGYVDPWTGAWDRADIWQYGPSIVTNYGGGNSLIAMAVSETPVPEPSTLLLVGIGLIGLAGLQRRKRNAG